VVDTFRWGLEQRREIEALEFTRGGEHVVLGARGPNIGPEKEPLGQIFNVFTLRDGRIVRIDDYRGRGEALEAAGVAGDGLALSRGERQAKSDARTNVNLQLDAVEANNLIPSPAVQPSATRLQLLATWSRVRGRARTRPLRGADGHCASGSARRSRTCCRSLYARASAASRCSNRRPIAAGRRART